MTVLHQILAVEKGAKNRALSALTEIHRTNGKPDLFAGQSRKYAPLRDDGEQLPPENTLVQREAEFVLKEAAGILTDLFDITAQRDFTNCKAKADVVVDGRVLVKDAPCTYLLFLEKQLIDVRTLVSELPTLDPALVWNKDPNAAQYRSEELVSQRTKKEQEPLVLLQPTKEHPGKAELITKDVTCGKWYTTKLSGALPIPRKQALLTKVEKLLRAVKFAREAANTVTVSDEPKVGDAVFSYLLA